MGGELISKGLSQREKVIIVTLALLVILVLSGIGYSLVQTNINAPSQHLQDVVNTRQHAVGETAVYESQLTQQVRP